jgi:hypothetical protein
MAAISADTVVAEREIVLWQHLANLSGPTFFRFGGGGGHFVCKHISRQYINIKRVEILDMRFPPPAKIQVEVFCVMIPSIVVGYQRFGGHFCLHLQGGYLQNCHASSLLPTVRCIADTFMDRIHSDA